jgi:hypothetical protein
MPQLKMSFYFSSLLCGRAKQIVPAFLKSCGMGVKFNHGWALRKEVKAELEGYKDSC